LVCFQLPGPISRSRFVAEMSMNNNIFGFRQPLRSQHLLVIPNIRVGGNNHFVKLSLWISWHLIPAGEVQINILSPLGNPVQYPFELYGRISTGSLHAELRTRSSRSCTDFKSANFGNGGNLTTFHFQTISASSPCTNKTPDH
jgi:hypothetical protein